jgi:hypothetical protein
MSDTTTPKVIEQVVIPDSDIVKAYSAVSGYDPNTGINDFGASCLDVLNYWRKNGIANHKIIAYASINVRNLPHIKVAIFLFGGIYLGINLPESAKKQDIWDVPATGTQTGAGVAGSWGGHCVCAIGYDDRYIYVISWGQMKKATWAFFSAYCQEAYAVIGEEFAGQKTPSGFDFNTLKADLKMLAG